MVRELFLKAFCGTLALHNNRLTQYTSAVKNVLAKYLGSKPAPGGLALVQGFINTAELEHGTDELSTPAGLRGWLTGVGLLERSAPVSTTDVGQATAVREALRAEPARHDALLRLSGVGDSVQLLPLAIGQAMLAAMRVRLGCCHARGGSRLVLRSARSTPAAGGLTGGAPAGRGLGLYPAGHADVAADHGP